MLKDNLMAAELFEKDNQDTACKGEQLSPPTDFIPIPKLTLEKCKDILICMRDPLKYIEADFV